MGDLFEEQGNNSTRAQNNAHEPHCMVNKLCCDKGQTDNSRTQKALAHEISILDRENFLKRLLPVASRSIWVKKQALNLVFKNYCTEDRRQVDVTGCQ